LPEISRAFTERGIRRAVVVNPMFAWLSGPTPAGGVVATALCRREHALLAWFASDADTAASLQTPIRKRNFCWQTCDAVISG
jgi:hypothetical protein